ncbi:hypothetical protein SUGI_0812210 [Cryptomeria japonica]|nr:hypothetical protein SUGI_0812210 [Cryptomeria japonica]
MAPPTGKSKHFVEWEEEYVSNDRGSRVVHYYLKDRHGNKRLAVVGTEKSLRHMVYVVSNEFLYLLGNSKSMSSSSSTTSSSSSSGSMKWRSRREVVDWLCSLLSRPRSAASSGDHSTKWPRHNASPMSDTDVSNDDEMAEHTNHTHKSKGHKKRKSRTCKEVFWIGAPWTCRKHLTHYQSFCCNGITISVHDFVYIMTEGKERHIAYLKDIFEDTKARKLVRVQWFCRTNEVLENIPPPAEHNERELFFASSCQNFNAECVDGLASVLLPEHYQECLSKLPVEMTNQLHMCYRQFDNDVIKPFDISQLEGYWHQKVFASIDLPIFRSSPKYDLTSDGLDVDDDQENVQNKVLRKGPRKCRSSRRHNVVHSHDPQVGRETSPAVSDGLCRLLACSEAVRDLSDCAPDSEQPIKCTSEKKEANMHGQTLVSFDIDDRLELLSQDSGIRGCWFRCKVIGKQSHRLKVWYEDVLNEDESGNLEEWVLASKVASPDKLRIRIPGRPAIRPFPSENRISSNIAVGTAVDAWWNDGWWEGVVIKISEPLIAVHVYFPGENETSVFQLKDLRISRDWVNNCWTELKETLNVAATLVSLHTEVREFSEPEDVEIYNIDKISLEIKEEIGVDLEKNEKEKPMHNLANAGGGLLGDLRWKSSKKRSRDATFSSRGNSSSAKQTKGARNKLIDSVRLNTEEDSLLASNKKDQIRRHKNSEDLAPGKRLRQGHESLKPIHGYPIGRPLFTASMPLSNLVMSR